MLVMACILRSAVHKPLHMLVVDTRLYLDHETDTKATLLLLIAGDWHSITEPSQSLLKVSTAFETEKVPSPFETMLC